MKKARALYPREYPLHIAVDQSRLIFIYLGSGEMVAIGTMWGNTAPYSPACEYLGQYTGGKDWRETARLVP